MSRGAPEGSWKHLKARARLWKQIRSRHRQRKGADTWMHREQVGVWRQVHSGTTVEEQKRRKWW